jgi:hypothetical protein
MSQDLDNFKPYQIVCLKYEATCLYAEVIQVISARKMCWVRPLILVRAIDYLEIGTTYDLRQTADLIWPVSLFCPALDTEVIPLLAQLAPLDSSCEDIQTARQQLHVFMRQVWQAYKVEPHIFG